MLKEVARIFKRLSNKSHLKKWISSFDRDVTTIAWEHDIYTEAAIYEVVAFIARRDARIARSAAMLLDPFWIELETPEDYLLVFDKT
jgi:hypothetical protein